MRHIFALLALPAFGLIAGAALVYAAAHMIAMPR